MLPKLSNKTVKILFLLSTIISGVCLSESFEDSLKNGPEIVEDSAPKSNFVLNFNYDEFIPSLETSAEFWRNSARREILKRLALPPTHLLRAKNIIFFIGDGMPLSAITAARIQRGQQHGKLGEESSLHFETFPNLALSKTYCTNAQVADSACSATAYLCGVKGNIQTIGVNGKVRYNNCEDSSNPKNHVNSIAAWAQKAGKSTGLVTTTRVTHASPAGIYAHVANRVWESDYDIRKTLDEEKSSSCIDIAQQLVKSPLGQNLNVIFGGGMSKFVPNNTIDSHGHWGERLDDENLLKLWQKTHPSGAIVTNRKELAHVIRDKNVTHTLGLFSSSHLKYYSKSNRQLQPTLAEMTTAAIRLMSENENGYFLFVEGGMIDTANHENKAGIAIDEIIELDKAVQSALLLTDPEDTLIVVSADHGHPLTISGFPGRGASITGLNPRSGDRNGLPYMTLNYPVGLKQYIDKNGQREDLSKLSITKDFIYPSLIPNDYGVHSGEDVGIFATGPQSQLFRGVMEQNTIPHIMAYAACIGDGLTMCNDYRHQGSRTPRRGRTIYRKNPFTLH